MDDYYRIMCTTVRWVTGTGCLRGLGLGLAPMLGGKVFRRLGEVRYKYLRYSSALRVLQGRIR